MKLQVDKHKLSRMPVVSAALVLAVMAAGARTSQAQSSSYEIAVDCDITGTSAAVGAPQVAGIRAAVEGQNRRGGVDGKKINLTVRDDLNTPATAISNVRRLLDNKETLALVGLNSSFIVSALVPLADTYKAAMLSPGVPDNLLTPVPKYLYMTIAGFGAQAIAMAEFAAAQAGKNGLPAKPRILSLHYDSPAATQWEAALEPALKRLGLELVDEQRFSNVATDVSAQAARVAEARPDIILGFILPNQMPLVNGALKAAGVNPAVPVINFTFGSAEAVLNAVGTERPYIAVANFNMTTDGKMASQARADAQAINVNPASGAYAEGYAQGLIVIDVLKRCGANCTREGFLAAMNQTKSDLGGFAFGPVVFTEQDHAGLSTVGLQKIGPNGSPVLVGQAPVKPK